jgi:Carbohydrate binding module (family 6)
MRTLVAVMCVVGLASGPGIVSHVPSDYRGKPYEDSVYKSGAQVIPGRVQCAYFDLGGEGVAYHDEDAINHGSGELNRNPRHQRPNATAYVWQFREKEGVDLSYVKDFADLNHKQNLVAPDENQLYVGWAKDGEWCNYTVDVKTAGTYKISALYGNAANTIKFSIDKTPATVCKLPLATGSMHKWNKAEIGTITFADPGLHLLTFHYNQGNNFAYFEFEHSQRE